MTLTQEFFQHHARPIERTPVWGVIGLAGQTLATFANRENAVALAQQWNRETDFSEQDKRDAEIFANIGRTFHPSRYWVMDVSCDE